MTALGTLGAALLANTAHGGQPVTFAYDNFPEVPSGWYATGCCVGATIADDIETAPGTEGMRLDEITMRLYVDGVATAFDVFIYAHDHETGLPGELLGTKWTALILPVENVVITLDIWDLDIRVPASRKLWIAVHAPTIQNGWSIADAEPTVGTTGNFYARKPGDDAFDFSYPFDPLTYINMYLRVSVVEEPCAADLNGDFQVGVDDLNQVILNWGCTDPPGPCPGDVNADGVVNVEDLVEVITEWGNCFDV